MDAATTAMVEGHGTGLPFGLGENPILIYLGIVISPVIQEDAATFGAAALAVSGMARDLPAFLAITLGLTLSDFYKYGLGWLAARKKWGRRFVTEDKLALGRRWLGERLGLTLFVVRFVPGTRVPAYLAAGFLGVPVGPFLFFVVLSAAAFAAVAFAVVSLAGAAIAEGLGPCLALIVLLLAGAYVGLRFAYRRMRSRGARTI